MPLGRTACALVVAAVAGCNVFGEYVGPVVDGGVAPNATAVDGGGVSDGAVAADSAPDATTPKPVGLLANGDFEAEGARCGPGWVAYSGQIDRGVGNAKAGCHACRSGSAADWFGVTHMFEPRPLAGTYHVDALYKSSLAIEKCEIGVNVLVVGGASTRQKTSTGCAPDAGEWQRLSLSVVVAEGEELVELYAGGFAAAGACFDVDDVILTKE